MTNIIDLKRKEKRKQTHTIFNNRKYNQLMPFFLFLFFCRRQFVNEINQQSADNSLFVIVYTINQDISLMEKFLTTMLGKET